MDSEKIKLEHNKIYHISYGSSTQILGRFKGEDTCNYFFYDRLHYWNGRENFSSSEDYCVKSGIEEIRRATQAEKMALLRFEIEYELI